MITFGSYLPIVLEGLTFLAIWMHVAVIPAYKGRNAPIAVRISKRLTTLFQILASSYVWYCLCFVPVPVTVNLFPLVWMEQKPIVLYAHALFFLWVCFQSGKS